ncbi:hypothetical protein [Streptomyces griseoaurantiacus]|uniref:hypothetical protein n=1 Tax=Streptomyces griseoaurantiacus TaxID=68213 RepID=UPI002E291769|nr:hypothetical protein [Streptomyces jietaisiensis]
MLPAHRLRLLPGGAEAGVTADHRDDVDERTVLDDRDRFTEHPGQETLSALATVPVLGHGEPAGSIRPAF